MADIELVIKIPEETYEYWKEHKYEYVLSEAIANGTPLPKGHFIAICESDYPITEKVEDTLKETVFVGGDDEHEDRYCFDIKEIIKADKEERK